MVYKYDETEIKRNKEQKINNKSKSYRSHAQRSEGTDKK